MLSDKRSWVVIPILMIFLLGSCNLPSARPTENPFPTFAAQTVEARLTLAAGENPPPDLPQATDTPVPTEPTEPEPTGTPTNTPIPTQTEVPCDRAAFVSDVTIPDGTVMSPGEDFTKTWRLRNTGSCSWNGSYKLIFKEGDAMGGAASQQLTVGTVSPGQTVDISIDLTAPNSQGDYRGDWLIRSDAGIVFGVGTSGNVAFYVEIEVGEPPPTVLSSGKFDVPQTYGVDLDTGNLVPIGAERDFKFTAVNPTTKYIEPWNSALFRYMGGSLPSLDDCKSASLNSNDVDFFTLSTYDYFCYKTTEGNYGRLEIEAITDNAGVHTIHFDYTTWDT
jgi:hypothetical protein